MAFESNRLAVRELVGIVAVRPYLAALAIGLQNSELTGCQALIRPDLDCGFLKVILNNENCFPASQPAIQASKPAKHFHPYLALGSWKLISAASLARLL